MRLTFIPAAGLALLLAACGDSSTPSTPTAGAPPPPEAKAQAPVQSTTAQAGDISEKVCGLLEAGDVESILGASPDAKPSPQPVKEGVARGGCIWEIAGGGGELRITVVEATDEANAALVLDAPVEGEALSGLGDQAGVSTKGDYRVEVVSRTGMQLVTVRASGMGMTDRKDAVVAVARAVVAKLR
jgi:hypothetical protein